jgi:putative hemolysin
MEDDYHLAFGLLALAAALALRSWLRLAESALLHVNEPEARQRAMAEEQGAEAVVALLDSGEYMSALLVAVNSLVLLMAAGAAALLATSGLASLQQTLLHLGLVALIVVASDLTPYVYGGLFAERIAYAIGPATLRFARWLGPLTRLLGVWLRLLHLRPAAAPRFVTAADILAAADLSEEGGEVEPEVGRMIDEVMGLSQTRAREVMTPRVQVVGVPAEAEATAMTETAIASGYSRLPVYEEDLDNIVGVLLVTDLIERLAAGEESVTARELARPALLTPESRPISDLLRDMRDQALHMALVIGEDGGTEGLVTIEDILEELVGEIEDEHDVPEEEIQSLAPGELLVEGRVRLSEVEERLQITFPPTEAETVGGLVVGLLGRIPREGEYVSFGGVRLEIEETEGQQIRWVRLTSVEEAD